MDQLQKYVSVQNPRFLRSQAIENYRLKIVHNCLYVAIASPI